MKKGDIVMVKTVDPIFEGVGVYENKKATQQIYLVRFKTELPTSLRNKFDDLFLGCFYEKEITRLGKDPKEFLDI